MNPIRKLFLDDRFVLVLIVVNAILIFIQAYPDTGYEKGLSLADDFISLLFLAELINKVSFYGIREYLKSTWNKFDVVLVLISLPSILINVLPEGSIPINLSTLLVLRVFRVFKFFRLIKFFPKVEQIFRSAQQAVASSGVVLLGFFVFIFIASLLTCYMFRDIAPDYFGNPFTSYYSMFQVFTIEGWMEIPNGIVASAENSGDPLSDVAVFFVRVLFIAFFIIGGIFGLSIVNALFVDTMINNTNAEMEEDIDHLQQNFEMLNVKLAELEKALSETLGDAGNSQNTPPVA